MRMQQIEYIYYLQPTPLSFCYVNRLSGGAPCWAYLNSGHILGEALVLLADLEGQFSRVAHHQDRHL